MPLGCAGGCRGRVFLAGPMSDSLALCTTLLCPYPARKRLPPCKTRASSILANAKAAPHPETSAKGVVIRPLVPSYEQKLTRVTKVVKSASGFTDRLATGLNDYLPIEKHIKFFTPPRLQRDYQWVTARCVIA